MRIPLFLAVALLALCEGKSHRGAEHGAPKQKEKQTTGDQHMPTVIQSKGQAPQVDKLKCHYRKSCYEGAGGDSAPDILPPKDVEEEAAQAPPDRYTAAQLKLLCKYRTSCYEKRGLNETAAKGMKKRSNTLLTSKPSLIITESTQHPRRHPHTVRDIAKATIRELEERNKHADQRPLLKLSPVKQLMHELKAGLKAKNVCKYRRSCYETGRVPQLSDGLQFPSWVRKGATLVTLPTSWVKSYAATMIPEDDEEHFEEMSRMERRLHCKYRKSCYENGVTPKIDDESNFHIKELVVSGQEKVEQRLELRCRYRKSCYESGLLPPQFSKEKGEDDSEAAKKRQAFSGQKHLPTSIDELRLFCKYRRSCYMKQADGGDKDEEKVELASKPVRDAVMNATLPRLKSEDAKQSVRGNPHSLHHPKVPVSQRRKEGQVRIAQMETPAAAVRRGQHRSPSTKRKAGKLGKMKKRVGVGVQEGVDAGKRRVNQKKSQAEPVGEKLKSSVERESPPVLPEVSASKKEESDELDHEISKRVSPIPLEKKLECFYRKSCYARISESELLALERKPSRERHAEARKATPRTHQGQQIADEQKLNCKYRKSCYAEILPQLGENPLHEEEEDENADEDVGSSQRVEEVRLPRTTTHDGQRLSPALKLECKYRHSCYSHTKVHQSHLNHSAGKNRGGRAGGHQSSIPTFTQEELLYCNKYWLSCQKELGLPIKEKAPMGPSGRKLCRRRLKPESNAHSTP